MKYIQFNVAMPFSYLQLDAPHRPLCAHRLQSFLTHIMKCETALRIAEYLESNKKHSLPQSVTRKDDR